MLDALKKFQAHMDIAQLSVDKAIENLPEDIDMRRELNVRLLDAQYSLQVIQSCLEMTPKQTPRKEVVGG